MSKTPSPAPAAPPLRPSLVDYCLLLVGLALSLYLSQRLEPLSAEPNESIQDGRVREVVTLLPDIMRLPEGVILLGPVFLILQFLRRRSQGLTTIEWLWVISWVGVALLAVQAELGRGFPDVTPSYASLAPRWWYTLFGLSMAALAGLLWTFGLFSRMPAPWTHQLGFVLIVWPALPLLGILALGQFK